MYLKEVSFKNYAALKDIKYAFQFNLDGTPKPTVFIGKNGTGKTLLLSNIAHSLIEIKRNFYQEISDVSGQSYYRMGSKNYITADENDAYSKITYDNDASYVDLMVRSYDSFRLKYDSKKYDGVDINDGELKRNGFYINNKKPSQNVFEQEVFLYFPVERYYIPTWVNKENNPSKFVYIDRNFVGRNDDSIIQYNLLENIESWILEVVIDQALYENQIIQIPEKDSGVLLPHRISIGKNTNIISSINNLLKNIYTNKYSSMKFVITPKQHGFRQIKILGIDETGKEKVVVPKFTGLNIFLWDSSLVEDIN